MPRPGNVKKKCRPSINRTTCNNPLSRLDWAHCGVCANLGWFFLFGFRIDLEEVVDDNQNHGRRAKEDGDAVKFVVGNHDGFFRE